MVPGTYGRGAMGMATWTGSGGTTAGMGPEGGAMNAIQAVNEVVLPDRIKLPQPQAAVDAVVALEFTRNGERLTGRGTGSAH